RHEVGERRARNSVCRCVHFVSEEARPHCQSHSYRRCSDGGLQDEMNIDYRNLEQDLLDGTFRSRLETELAIGFKDIQESGERLPPPSYFAAQIAEIVDREVELSEEM